MARRELCLDLEQFRHLWESKEWETGQSMQLYVDSPFCLRKCSFCIYNSIQATPDSEIYKKYYLEYLPQQLSAFSDVVRNSPVSSIYFGGGTASLMTPEIMEQIFELIPDFKGIGTKFFEANPTTLDRSKMDVLVSEGFTYVSLGVQTLDKNLSLRENREPISAETLAWKVEYLQSNGVHVNCDLIAFLRSGTVDDLKDLRQDLEILENVVRPHVIVVYPMYQNISCKFSTDNVQYYEGTEADHNFHLISQLRRELMDFCQTSNRYRPASYNVCDLTRKGVLRDSQTDYYLSTLTPHEMSFRDQYNSSGYPRHRENQNVLAFGGYGRRMPYSYMGRSYYYMHLNLNWKPFFLLRP